jgi:hypothetical protein
VLNGQQDAGRIMALNPGNISATSGMAKKIYDAMEDVLDIPAEARSHIKKLSYAIAKGVIQYVKENAEVKKVKINVGDSTYSQKGTGKVD